MLSDGKTGFLESQKPGFTTLVNKQSSTQNPDKPGFQRKQVNPQQPYLLISRINQVHHDFSSSWETRFSSLRLVIIMLSDGKTGFLGFLRQ
jgi:hypothetical protein